MMRILVTGASGFVGSATCSHLTELGHEVIRWVGPGNTDEGTAGTFSVDISDESTFPDQDLVGQIDAVVHCAGIAHRFGRISKGDFECVNVRGVENAIRFAGRAGAKKFILLSSVLVYGSPRNDHPVNEESPTAPADDYAMSKLAGEEVALRLCRSSKIKLVILRPVPIVGEGSRGNVSRLIQAIDRNRFLWIGDGRNKRSFVYVGDVARAIACSLYIDDDFSVFNVSGETISVQWLVELIARRLETTVPRLRVPTWAARAAFHGSSFALWIPTVDRHRRTLETWLAHAVYSGEAFKKRYGFAPGTTIEEAIDREVDHFLQNR